MAKIDCSACDELKENAATFTTSGVTSDVCTSLKNDTGFSAKNSRTNCEDLDDANDCLIGMMDGQIESHEPCEWKEYMHKFVPNLHQLLKAFICSMCGIWTNIHSLWNAVNTIVSQSDRIDCIIEYMFKGHAFKIDEEPSDGSYVVAGKGVSFYEVSAGEEFTSDITLRYVAGGLIQGYGSLRLHSTNFTDRKSCVNFDNGSTERTSTARLGNSNFSQTGRYANGGELLYEIRMRKSAYPEIAGLYGGLGHETGGGAYRTITRIFTAGEYAYGNHGACDSHGDPQQTGYDSGHIVPDGWIYVQLRITYVDLAFGDGVQYTPMYLMGIRFNQDKIEC